MQDKPAPEQSVPQAAYWLGLSGLLPQLAFVALAIYGGGWGWIALAAGFAYAALIFSFLGGIWWGQAMQSDRVPRWAFAVAVMPSLLALGLFLPWTVGADWPGPSLLWLGLMLCLTPFVDRSLNFGDGAWMAFRWRLSLGLGGLTVILSLLALRPY
ncbi:DUF3429 domain-containing protein [Altererythrobacter sp.]|nr:DUF3429 domain-containing protein [Altererythrobacter sp.]